MRVKVVFGGEALNIPWTQIGLGIAIIKVWVDGRGFTSASNSIGSLGYILLETPTTDIGNVDDERRAIFTNLHGRAVHWTIQTNLFVKDGGIATVTLAVAIEQDGIVVEKRIQFQATDCRGVSGLTNALDFTCDMLQMEQDQLAETNTDQVLSDDVVASAADNAPEPSGAAA